MIALLLLASCQDTGTVGLETGGEPTDSDSAVDSAPWTGGDLRINEVLAVNDGGLEDTDGDTSDWIELFNPGPETVDLAGWALSDDDGDGWVLPAGELVAGGFLVVFASGKDRVEGQWHTDFRLSGDGEVLRLVRPDGVEADRLDFGLQRPDVSFGVEQETEEATWVADGSAVRWTGSSPAAGWADPEFDDSAWSPGELPVGFDLAGVSGDEPTTEVALFRTTTQSSHGYGRTGAEATDGELSTFSHTGDADLAPWWQVDLGEVFPVVTVDLFNRVDCCPERLYNITVDLRDADGAVVWSSEPLNPTSEGTTPVDPGEQLSVTPGGVDARFVRVSKTAVNGAGSSEWMSLAEVQVHAAEPSPYQERLGTDLAGLLEGPEVWLRIPVAGDTAPDALSLLAEVDDAVSWWLDGESVEAGWLAPAAPGSLAAHLTSTDDDDLFLSATLTAWTLTDGELAHFRTPTPGAPNGLGFGGWVDEVQVDPPRGFYDAPLTVTLATETTGAVLVYTLDGSAPSAVHGTVVPSSEATLELATTAVLRVVALHDDLEPSSIATHTYLDLDDVIRQPADPEGFPATWDGLEQSAVTADYEMDPEVALDPAYTDDLLAGLRAIPTLSLVLDPDDLFGADDGLYVHSLQRGTEWERPASAELILPDNTTGFAEECGVRLHGYGWRYHSSTLKHALRLEFRPEYGDSKLDYPLFADAPVDRFDSIVLRSQGSRGWQDFRDPEQAQYLRDAFARDTAAAMGKVDGHATFVHLYLNGLYWGLYNPVERPDAGFAEERFGGSDADYDAINRRTSTNEAINGDLEAYNTLLALVDEDLTVAENYAAVEAMLNLDDLIDYMLIHQYTSNRDGPEEFSHNNMRGVRHRDGGQFHFFVWDMEYSLWEFDRDVNVDVDVSGSASHMYARLRTSEDFRAGYAERARLHLTGDGALTPEAGLARWDARAEEIWDAIVAESARWGDTDRATPYTRDVEWLTERERLRTEYFPYRTEWLIERLEEAGLY